MDIQSNIVIDRQYKALGVYAHRKHGQCNAIQGSVAVHIKHNPICVRVIGLSECTAIRQLKHGAGSYKGDRGAGGHTAGCDGSIYIFRSARHQCQRGFDVLNIILGEGEHLLGFVLHAAGSGTASPVGDLEVFVH